MILQLNEKYKFYVGSERVYPVNDSIDWTYEANEDLGILRKKMSTKMTFENDVTAGHYCYDIIKELEETSRCISEDFVVMHLCGVVETEVYRGRLKSVLGEYDPDHCTVEIDIEFRDDLSCFLDDKPQVTWMGGGDGDGGSVGNFQFAVCTSVVKDFELLALAYENEEDVVQYFLDKYPPDASCLPNDIFTLYEYGAAFDNGSWLFGDGRIYLYNYYGRIIRYSEPNPIEGWTETTDALGDPIWVRPAEVAEFYLYDEVITATRVIGDDPITVNLRIDSRIGKRWRVYDMPYMAYRRFDYTYTGSRKGGSGPLGNRVNLVNVINGIIGFCNSEENAVYFRSNFFNWNPYGTQPYNEAYALMEDLLSKGTLYCYNLVDVAYHYPEDRGNTIDYSEYQKIDALEFLKALKEYFNLGFSYDDATNYVTIEHISYFDLERRIDLTAEELVDYIRGNHKYNYDVQKSPLKEEYRMAMEASNTFTMDITYSGNCISPDRQTEQHTSVNIYTDLRYISDVRSEGAYYEMRLGIRPDDDPPIGKATLFFPVQKFQEDNPFKHPAQNTIFLALIDDNNHFVWDENYPRPNELLSYRALEVLHYWKRPLLEGTINDDELPTDFLTQRRLKQQVDLTIPICCDDVNNFQGNILVKSQMGWGEIKKAVISDPPQEITLSLLHDVDSGSTYNPTT